MTRFRLLLLSTALTGSSCAPADPSAEAGSPAAAESAPATASLLASLQARPFGRDSVQFTLQVTNTTAAPLRLSYASGQSFDFIVSRAGQEVWRASSEMMYTQALRTETLGAGATESHSATWTPPAGARGEYTVRGVLTARNVEAGQTAAFRIE